MKRSTALLIGLMTAHWLAGSAVAQSIDPEAPCLGQQYLVCKMAMEQRFRSVDGNLDERESSRVSTDISGKQSYRGYSGYFRFNASERRGITDFRTLDVSVSSNGQVSSIGVEPATAIGLASTESEYFATKVYELVNMGLPVTGCPENERHAFYKFFHERIKPTVKGPKRNGYVGATSASDGYKYDSDRIPICGVYLSYSRDEGISTLYMSDSNPSGRYNNAKVTLWLEPDSL